MRAKKTYLANYFEGERAAGHKCDGAFSEHARWAAGKVSHVECREDRILKVPERKKLGRVGKLEVRHLT